MATVQWTMQQAPAKGAPLTLLPYQVCFDYVNDDLYVGSSDSAPIFVGPIWADVITAPLRLTIDPDTGGLSASMPAATSTQNGYLSSSDYGTFSGKKGYGDFSASGSAPLTLSYNSTNGAVTGSIVAATSTQNGYLSSSDFSTFAAKIGATTGAFTAPVSVTSTTANQLTVSYNTSNKFTADVSSGGAVTLTATGTAAGFAYASAVTANAGLSVLGTTTANKITSDCGLNLTQVANPSAAGLSLALAAGGSNLGIGTYYYHVTYYTALGETACEGSGSKTVTTDAGNRKVTVTIPVSSDSRVVGRKIYRSLVNGQYYNDHLIATVGDNTTVTYTDDNVDNSSAGSFYRANTTNQQLTLGGAKAVFVDTAQTLVGLQAGTSITSGGNYTLIGYRAGYALTTGNNFVLIGTSAGVSYRAGAQNVAVGDSSSNYGRDGAYNASVGHNSLFSNQDGYSNTAMGAYAIFGSGSAATCADNTAVGYSALRVTSTGSKNTAVGVYAGGSQTTVSNSIHLGYYAGRYETVGAKLFVDAFDRTDEAGQRANAIIYGVMHSSGAASQSLYINSATLQQSYNTSNYYTTTVSSAGLVTWDAVGTSSGFAFADPVTVGSASPVAAILGVGGTHNASVAVIGGSVNSTTYAFANQVSTTVVSTGNHVYGWYNNPTLTPKSGYWAENFSLQGTIAVASGSSVAFANQVDVGNFSKSGTGTISNAVGIHIQDQTVGVANYGIYAPGTTNKFYFAGNVGIGVNAPEAKLHVVAATEQLRVGYNTSNYYTTTVSSAGMVTFDATGTGSKFVFADIINIPTATPASATANGTTGDICWDADYVYVCVASSQWKRAALSSW